MEEEPRIIPASDDKGHSATFPVRIPPDWVRQIDIAVVNPEICYKNRGDFIRDALIRHFEFISYYQGGNLSILANIQAMTDLIEEDRIQQNFEMVIANLENRVDFYKEKGAVREAARVILKTLRYANNFPDGYWKEEFNKRIIERYQGLLGNIQKANLIPDGE